MNLTRIIEKASEQAGEKHPNRINKTMYRLVESFFSVPNREAFRREWDSLPESDRIEIGAMVSEINPD